MAAVTAPHLAHHPMLAGSLTARALPGIDLTYRWGWLLAALLATLILIAGAFIIFRDKQQHFRAALVFVAPWVPTVGSVSTVVAYLILLDAFPVSPTGGNHAAVPKMWVSDVAVFIGGATGIIAWLLLAALCRPFTRARSANTGEYGDLQLRLRAVRDRLSLSCACANHAEAGAIADEALAGDAPHPAPATPPLLGLMHTALHLVSPLSAVSPPAVDRQQTTVAGANPCHDCPLGGPVNGERCSIRRAGIARQAATMVRDAVLQALRDEDADGNMCDGLPWVLGTGYVERWRLLHAAEEALIDLESVDIVVRDALYDEARICGCNIDNAPHLLTQLRRAVSTLSPQATPYLKELPPEPAPNGSRNCESAGAKVDLTLSFDGLDPACASFRRELIGRSMLRQVRHAINTYRDASRAGLVRARNKLIKTIIMTGVATYGLLALAVMRGAQEPAVVAGVAFYLVGAAVGLFNRLYQEAQADSAIDDFGLSTARLIHAPMFSGLAAVGGVVITALLAVVLNFTVTGAGAHAAPTSLPALSQIFNLQSNQAGIVVAAIFGLTPNLLIQRLNTAAEQYKSELKNSQALGQRAASG